MFVGKARSLSLLESPEKCSTQVGYLVTKIRLGYKSLREQKATANFVAVTKEIFITSTPVVNVINFFLSIIHVQV